MIGRIAGTLLAIVVSSQAALAQQPAVLPAPSIDPGATIFVLDNQKTEHMGKFVRFDDQELVMLVGNDERRFRRDVITRIQRNGDSLKNGALIGAVVGVLMGLAAASLQAEDAGDWIAAVGIDTALFAAIGTGLDAAVKGRTVVYRAPPAPVRQRSGAALAFTVRW